MVDVHVRVLREPRVDEVDEPLEGGLLLLAARRPQRLERVVAVAEAPEVLEAALGIPERVALEVEEEVAGRRVGEERESGCRLRREELPAVLVAEPRLELERGLVVEPLEGRLGHARGPLLGRECAPPSAASVATPRRSSFSIWPRLIPATRQRWSTASQCASQSGLKSQMRHCGQGNGSVPGGEPTNSSSRCRTRR